MTKERQPYYLNKSEKEFDSLIRTQIKIKINLKKLTHDTKRICKQVLSLCRRG